MLLKKTHILRCAQSPHVNVLPNYASVRRFIARLGSETFLSSLKSGFFINLRASPRSVRFRGTCSCSFRKLSIRIHKHNHVDCPAHQHVYVNQSRRNDV